MVEMMERKSLKKENDLDKILNSTREYYRAYSDEYVKFYDNWLRKEGSFSDSEYKMGYDQVAKILTGLVSDEQLIIDIGCGVGIWSILMAKSGSHVIGLDHALEALLKHKKRSKDANVESKISRILGDGFYTPFRNGIFDGATLNWVLAHIPIKKSRKFMKEVKRIMKRNASLMISDSYWRGQKGGKEQKQLRKTNKGTFEVYKYYYTIEELQNLLEVTFGEVVQIETTPYEILCVARKYKN